MSSSTQYGDAAAEIKAICANAPKFGIKPEKTTLAPLPDAGGSSSLPNASTGQLKRQWSE
jgi:hypothetical protein